LPGPQRQENRLRPLGDEIPWLIAAGFTDEQVDLLFEEFGQGFQSMSPALRDLESVLLNGQLRHANHPVLTMCAANAVVSTDPAGGRKLNKAKAAGRIDGMVALAMAFGVAPLEAEQPLDVMAMIA
jgi:phage terminase large subunit-like protein